MCTEVGHSAPVCSVARLRGYWERVSADIGLGQGHREDHGLARLHGLVRHSADVMVGRDEKEIVMNKNACL